MALKKMLVSAVAASVIAGLACAGSPCTAVAADGNCRGQLNALWQRCGAYGRPPFESGGLAIIDPLPGKPGLWVKGTAAGAVVTIALDEAAVDPGSAASDFSVRLRHAFGPFQLEAEVVVANVEILSDAVRLTVAVPEELPADVYTLEVSVPCGSDILSTTRPNAVKIVDALKDTYTIVHVTDIHVGDPRGFLVNARESAGNGSIRHMIRMVNLLNPELVIMTGDHVFGASYVCEYLRLYELLQELNVPVFMSIGNHDAIKHASGAAPGALDGAEVFTSLFAPLTYAVDYGRMRYFSLNSMDWTDAQRRGLGILTLAIGGQMRDPQLDWLEQELAGTDAGLILSGFHHPPHYAFQGAGADRFRSIAARYQIDAVLTGHIHREEVLQEEGVLYLTTASLMFSGHGGAYPALRMLEIREGQLQSWNYAEPRWSVPVYRDSEPYGNNLRALQEPSLSCAYTPANDGSSAEVTATITNHLDRGFETLRLKFCMPQPGAGRTYAVSGGEVVDVYDAGDGQLWYVAAPVGPRQSRQVTLAPAPAMR